MVSLKSFVEDMRVEKRMQHERGLIAFTLTLTAFFVILSLIVSSL